ncbi:hypothetical protein D3C86_1869350 [compost metagenome]
MAFLSSLWWGMGGTRSSERLSCSAAILRARSSTEAVAGRVVKKGLSAASRDEGRMAASLQNASWLAALVTWVARAIASSGLRLVVGTTRFMIPTPTLPLLPAICGATSTFS